MRKAVCTWLCAALLIVSYHISHAQDLTPVVLLKDGAIASSTPAQAWLDSAAKEHTGTDPIQVIIQFNDLPTQQQRTTLQQAGITLADYIPNNSFIAFVRFPVNSASISALPVKGIINIQPAWKMDLAVRKLTGTIPVEVQAAFYSFVDAKIIKDFIELQGGKIIPNNMEAYGSYKISIAPAKLPVIAQWYGTMYINMPTRNALLDIGSNAAGKSAIAQAGTLAGGHGLLGDGIAVGIGDEASGIYHTDLKDRVINYNPAVIADHGIHVNGIVGGAAIIDPYAQGVAPHVTLVDQFFDNVIAAAGLMYQAHKIVATNNSYATRTGSCDYSGTYDIYSYLLDSISLQYGNVLHIFAAANDGGLVCTPYPAGFRSIAGGYQVSKNALVVGNSNKLLFDRYTSSQGPTRDGRLKPEISAVGENVYSTTLVDQYINMTGTSMACPGVTGAASLLAQRYKQLHGTTPPSDILKALLANGATDEGNPGPDYKYGFGFLNLYRSLQILDSNHYNTGSISTGSQQTYTITVPANTALLKVMLYWNDAPASILSANQLVNDLDLSVQSSTGTHLPLVADTAAANVNNAATERIDHVNNCEQVVIANPTVGSYTINVNGYHTPSGTIPYVVAYDFVPVGLRVEYPFTGAATFTDDTLRIYWDASADNKTFTLQYSIDNGTNWNTLSNNIPDSQHYYNWVPTGISSGRCMVRLLRNNTTQQYTTGAFAINPQPKVQLDSVQCSGYISIYWPPIANATAYQVWRKIGAAIQVIDTVAATQYALGGLSLDSTYFVSISPIVDGASGYRAVAVTRRPNTGSCMGAYSAGDLMVQQIVTPNSGRQHTSSALTNNETLSVLVRDLYNTSCGNYSIAYSINNSAWQAASTIPVIQPNSTAIVNFSGLDLSAIGIYHIRVAIHNLAVADPIHQNDTLDKTIVNLVNAPIDLTATYADGFEDFDSTTIVDNEIGISPSGHWDYNNSNDTGRLRTYINDSILISGQRSISMDVVLNDTVGIQNYLIGTMNLSNYSAQSSEVRLEFDYVLHGRPKFTDGNDVWVRGIDTQAWVRLYNYNVNSRAGQLNNSGTLSVSDAMQHSGQDFSGGFQVRFGQRDTSLIAAKDYGNGITLDNFKMYTVQNDVELVSIVSPQPAECGLGAQTPLMVKVKNGVNVALNNVLLYYQLDNGAITTDTLTSLTPKDSVLFTFRKNLDLSALGAHTLDVWVAATGDTYHANDSILQYRFHNQPLITSYPYLQDFEASDGYWYPDGVKSSWAYGVPQTQQVNKAASGTHVWKTNLTGAYNNLEQSYLYSPCFDISRLADPMFSCSLVIDDENCGNTLCDGAYIEYSYDGLSWTRLGASGQGTNWYNDGNYQLWSDHSSTRWHVASIPLPTSTQPIRLRFVMRSDPGVSYNGITVDDIHIYDRAAPIYAGTDISVSNDLIANEWTNYIANSNLLAQIEPAANMKSVTTALYTHDALVNPAATQYYFPKSFTIKAAKLPIDTTNVRLYITDADVLSMLADTSCVSCTKPADAYRLGITQYSNRNTDVENGSLADNTGGVYTYHPYATVRWVPYDAGYYAQLPVTTFSEFWFNDGGPLQNTAVEIDYLTFNARKINQQLVQTDWTSLIDTAVSSYELQRSYDGSSFITIHTQQASHQSTAQYLYNDTPAVTEGGSVYYRLHWFMNDGRTYLSPIRRVDWTAENQLVALYPNPVSNGNIFIRWTANTGADMQVALSDVSGRIVYRTTLVASEWNNYSVIQTPHLGTGMYFIRLQIGDRQYVRKLLYE